jgi:UPF0716 protein FxsA
VSLRAFLIFVVAPAVEIFVFVEVARLIGLGWALLALVAGAAVGAWVMRLAGAAGWRALRGQVVVDGAQGGTGSGGAVVQGRPDGPAAADAALLFLAGLLIFLPGFISDLFGLLLLLPPTRVLVRGVAAAWFVRRFTSVEGPGGVRLWVRNGRVVPGQVVREDGSPGAGVPGGPGGPSGGPPSQLPPADPTP